jgi:hypothetical protein
MTHVKVIENNKTTLLNKSVLNSAILYFRINAT